MARDTAPGGSTPYSEVTMVCRSNGSLVRTPESLHMGTFLAKCLSNWVLHFIIIPTTGVQTVYFQQL